MRRTDPKTTIKEIRLLAQEAGIKMTRTPRSWRTRGYWLNNLPIYGDFLIFQDSPSRDQAKLMLLGTIEYNRRIKSGGADDE
jgi:hypothetical protein